MIEAIVTFKNINDPVVAYPILTYVRGEGYWQLMCQDGRTVLIPDSSVLMIEIAPVTQTTTEE